MLEKLRLLDEVIYALIDPYKSSDNSLRVALRGHELIEEIKNEISVDKEYAASIGIETLAISENTMRSLLIAGLGTVRKILDYTNSGMKLDRIKCISRKQAQEIDHAIRFALSHEKTYLENTASAE